MLYCSSFGQPLNFVHWYQPDHNPICWSNDDVRPICVTLPGPSTTFFNSFKCLTHPCCCICHLGQGEILTKANPWTAIEWNIRPWFRSPLCPPGRIEVINSWAEKVFSTLHPQGRIIAGSSSRYDDRLMFSVILGWKVH